jgi:hypothetical protein
VLFQVILLVEPKFRNNRNNLLLVLGDALVLNNFTTHLRLEFSARIHEPNLLSPCEHIHQRRINLLLQFEGHVFFEVVFDAGDLVPRLLKFEHDSFQVHIDFPLQLLDQVQVALGILQHS